jgi:hypothetical protein
MAFIAIAFAIIPGIVRTRKQIRAMRLGRDGERAVGQALEQLRRYGYRVFHDILGPNWNIDHVVIGPGGIFTVETKTLSKPLRGRAVIRYERRSLTKGRFDISKHLDQARETQLSPEQIKSAASALSIEIRSTYVAA